MSANRKSKPSGNRKQGNSAKSNFAKKPTSNSGKRVDKRPDIQKKSKEVLPKFSEEVRLNKYIANLGICSRREADVLIAAGVVSVNGEIVTEMGYKVKPTDVVQYDGESVRPEKKRYLLINKPKDFVSSNNDPWGRRSIMALAAKAVKERVVPIDKLDKESSGLLLLTNDNDLNLKLSSSSVKLNQLFHVTLKSAVTEEHLAKLTEEGIFMDNGKVTFEEATPVAGKKNYEIGVRIKSTNFKIIKRLFEKLGYEVERLDRLEYGPLTKKDLPRGNYRLLTEQEVAFLKMC